MSSDSPILNSPGADLDLDPLLRNLARAFDLEPTINSGAESTISDEENQAARAADILEQVRFGGLSSTQELEAGTVLGSYRLLEVLGVGGMSTVYRAEHIAMRRRVALKVLSFSLASNKQFVDRFYREAQAAARLDHPNVVKVHDINSQGHIHYLVMEFVDGRTIRETVDVGGPMAVPQALAYLNQTVSALAHAHKQGIVHRDIKPENLVVDSEERPQVSLRGEERANTGRIKLLDMGLARLSEMEDRLLTVYDTMLGTVDYIAPEQAENSHDVDARADIYSLGCTLYFMLAGHPPFPNGTPAQRLMFHLLKQPTKLSALRTDIPPALDSLLGRMMAKAPQDRYQSADELAVAIEECLAAVAPAAVSAPVVPPAAPAPAPIAAAPVAVVPPPSLEESDLPAINPGQTTVWSRDRTAANSARLRAAAPAAGEPRESKGEADAASANAPPAEVRVTVRKLLELRAGGLEPDVARAVRDKIKTLPQVAEIHQRIEAVVSRNWLEPPEVDDEHMNANDVAAYVDNTIEERGARTNYERLCLDADKYLAETADCLAIITAQADVDPRRTISAESRAKLYKMSERLANIERRVGQLVTGLNDKDTFVRELSAEALGRIGPDAFGAAEKLAKSIEDPDRKVRETARDALRKIRGRSDEETG